MNSAIKLMLKSVGQEVYERKITGSTAGATHMDTPDDTYRRQRIYGVFSITTREYFEKMGMSDQADGILFTLKRINMTSQIEYQEDVYEIHKEIVDNYYMFEKGYTYILRLKGRRYL